MSGDKWRKVTKRKPCPACSKPDWCAWTPDGELLKCERSAEAPSNMELVELRDGGALFRFPRSERRAVDARRRPASTAPRVNWQNEATTLQAKLSHQRRAELARDLGVCVHALEALGVGWADSADLRRFRAGGQSWNGDYPSGAFAFPERDGRGRIVGVSLRAPDGRKGAPHSDTGARRGLIVPTTLADTADPVLALEGATDVAAALSVKLAAVGRPSNAAGADELAQLLRGRDVLVVGERDQKPSGQWPGRDGADSIATRIGSAWKRPVLWSLPPHGAKDVRAWLQGRIDQGLDLADDDACRRAGEELLALLTESPDTAEPEAKATQAELVVRLAHERFRIGQASDGEPFAVEIDGPNVACSLRGANCSLRARLARLYRERYRGTPNASALADALTVLQGEAQEATPEAVYLRVASMGDEIVIDVGDTKGRAIVVSAASWRVLERSPVLFRRTALTAAMPTPERGGSVDELWELLNVAEGDRALLLGWIIAAFIADIPHAILLLGGEQGTGKTWVLFVLVSIISPSPVPHRSQPRDVEDWAIPVSACWCSAFDNVSTIPPWWSDLLCKGSTGDGFAKRRLYTDGDLAVLAFRRVLVLSSIDAGALRGDLGDRVLLIDLERITREKRLTETELKPRLQACHGRVLGAVLDVLVRVLGELPRTRPTALPRMADFARILAAMDAAIGTDALSRYAAQGPRIAEEVLDGDPVGEHVQALVRAREQWHGAAGELLDAVQTPELKSVPGWPRSAKAFGARLRRLAPALRAVGIDVTPPPRTDKTRRWFLRVTGEATDSSARTAQPPDNEARASGDSGGPIPDASVDRYAAEERDAIQNEGAA